MIRHPPRSPLSPSPPLSRSARGAGGPGGGGPGAAPPVGPSGNVAGPGPDQMYDLSLQQFRRGSLATARIGFREFLRVYPAHDRAPDALFFVGETFAGRSEESRVGKEGRSRRSPDY